MDTGTTLACHPFITSDGVARSLVAIAAWVSRIFSGAGVVLDR